MNRNTALSLFSITVLLLVLFIGSTESNKGNREVATVRANSQTVIAETADFDNDGISETEIPSGYTTRDIDSDGMLELVLIKNLNTLVAQNLPTIADTTKPTQYKEVWRIGGAVTPTYAHLIEKLDNDNLFDLVILEGTTIRILENSGNNQFSEVWSYTNTGLPFYYNEVAFGDVDNDGKKEILVGQGTQASGGQQIHIFSSDGDNSYVLEKELIVPQAPSGNTGYGLVAALKVGDVNGDGTLDFVVGISDKTFNTFPQQKGSHIVAYSFNNITGIYEVILNFDTAVQFHPEYITALAIGDSDNDGQPEIIFVERVFVTMHVLEYDGTNFVYTIRPSGISQGVSSDLIIADIDGDNNNEVLAAVTNSIGVLESQGGSSYSLVWQSPVTEGNISAIDIHRGHFPVFIGVSSGVSALSGDGEVLIGKYNGNQYTIEDSFIIPKAPGLSATRLKAISIGGFDGDGQRDIIISKYLGHVMYEEVF